MPTGYTQSLYDVATKDKTMPTFAQFAINCSRALDYNIGLKEYSPSSPQDFLKADLDWYYDIWQRSMKERDEWWAMTIHERQTAYYAYVVERTNSIKKINDDNDKLRSVYQSMLDQVWAWTPPTKKHAVLKDFMRQQLMESIERDCAPAVGSFMSYEEWVSHNNVRVEQTLNFRQGEYFSAVKRSDQRIKFMQDLFDSLGVEY